MNAGFTMDFKWNMEMDGVGGELSLGVRWMHDSGFLGISHFKQMMNDIRDDMDGRFQTETDVD